MHPLLVHLPIGILLLAALCEGLGGLPRWAYLRPAVPFMVRTGAIAAVLACLTGWQLAASGAYGGDTLWWHRWLGIGTAVAALAAGWLPGRRVWMAVGTGLLVAAGHLGGTLTHGAGFLWGRPSDADAVGHLPAFNPATGEVYADLIGPILQTKCAEACHNASKQKGKLRLDAWEYLLKGGKNGAALVPGDVEKSLLLQRIALPLGHDDHMPPQSKPQLSAAEQTLLRWWIEQGAPTDKKIADLPKPPAVVAALEAVGKDAKGEAAPAPSDVPAAEVPPAPEALLAQIRRHEVSVFPVAQGSHYLAANFVNAPSPSDSLLDLLEKTAPQLVWLRLGGVKMPPGGWTKIGRLNQLTKLYLERSSIVDADLPALVALKQLRYLNLSGTQVTAKGAAVLSGLPVLDALYLYDADISGADWAVLQAALPKVKLDSGGYRVPTLASDTTRLSSKR